MAAGSCCEIVHIAMIWALLHEAIVGNSISSWISTHTIANLLFVSVILRSRRHRHVNNFWPHFQTIILSSGAMFFLILCSCN